MAFPGIDDAPSRSRSESSDDSDSQDSDNMRKESTGPHKSSDSKVKKPANKDPNRVKRKKARRACENCQRAHLTCSDKRPCERCGDKKPCRDGKRKKAKYLEGTRDEDLTPRQEKEEDERRRALERNPLGRRFPNEFPPGLPASIYGTQQTGLPGFPLFTPSGPGIQIPPQSYSNQMLAAAQPYNVAPHQQAQSASNYSSAFPANTQMYANSGQSPFADNLFPELDLDSLGFDNKFGAMEYGVLGHMSSGMVDTPPNDTGVTYDLGSGNSYTSMPTSYGSSPTATQHYPFGQPGPASGNHVYNIGTQLPDSFDGTVKQESRAYGADNGYPSPISGPSPQGTMAGLEGNPSANDLSTNINQSHQAQRLQEAQSHRRQTLSDSSASTIPTTSFNPQTHSLRRSRNPSTIYNMVIEPHSYTKAFHDLMALIRKRFSQQRTAHIAKALASIRPSFISSLTKLDDDDRVFMEKCLQRTLLEYEDNLSLIGTPTILCRRTGEVVAVGEGFSILTGWKKAVLLGREPNLNINNGRGATTQPNAGASGFRGTDAPLSFDGGASDSTRPKPVSIVDLLDDQSVCDFFDDYAHLAFGDSRGSVTTPCKLLKYRTARDMNVDSNPDNDLESRSKYQRNNNLTEMGASVPDDVVECMLCWSVKRDVFDIPMLFVMNVLPCI